MRGAEMRKSKLNRTKNTVRRLEEKSNQAKWKRDHDKEIRKSLEPEQSKMWP